MITGETFLERQGYSHTFNLQPTFEDQVQKIDWITTEPEPYCELAITNELGKELKLKLIMSVASTGSFLLENNSDISFTGFSLAGDYNESFGRGERFGIESGDLIKAGDVFYKFEISTKDKQVSLRRITLKEANEYVDAQS